MLLLLTSQALAADPEPPDTASGPEALEGEAPEAEDPEDDAPPPERDAQPQDPAPPEELSEGSLFILGARVWDGTGADARTASILIRDGVIEAVAEGLPAPRDVRVISGRELTVLPGLIDAHVHLASIAGSALRGDDMATLEAMVQQGLRAYLACGVTTVLDTGIPHEHARTILSWLESGLPGPNVEVLGLPVSPPGGYITTVFPEAPAQGTPEALIEHLDALVALGAAGVKVTMEEGFIRRDWPLQTPEMRAVITREAAARGLPLYIHGMSPREYELSLDMGVHAMVHPLDWPDRQVINRLRDEGTYVISTIGIADMFRVATDPERLADPLTRMVVPELVLATAADPAMRDAYREAVLEVMLPGLPGALEGLAARQLDAAGAVRRRTRALQASVRELHDAGVAVVVGSDAGNWTMVPYSFHGVATLRELELWQDAGIDPVDTLLAATRRPAEMIGLADEVGTLEPGKRADLLIVAGDPLEDLSALRSILYTVKDGVARTPEEWMED